MAAVVALLQGVRRRLRVAWGVATGLLAAALVLVLIGRVRPWAWPEPAALGLGIAAAAALVLAAALIRVPLPLVARAADRGLDTRDVFATALQFRDHDGLLPEYVQRRAARLAKGARPADAIPLRTSVKRVAFLAGAAALVVGLAIAPNRQDDVRRRQAAEHRALDEDAAKVREAAAAIAEAPDATAADQAVAERLRELAQELARA